MITTRNSHTHATPAVATDSELSALQSGSPTEVAEATPGVPGLMQKGLPWQVAPDALARVQWIDPQRRRGVLWVDTAPGGAAGRWLDVVQSVDEGYLHGRLEQSGRRFAAISAAGQTGPMYYPTQGGNWGRGSLFGGVGRAMFSSERSRFYAYVTEIAYREQAVEEWCDTVMLDVQERMEISDEAFMLGWNAMIDAWHPVQEPKVHQIIDRIMANSPDACGSGQLSPQSTALQALRDAFVQFPHIEDNIRDALCFLQTAREWWATRAELESPIQNKIARLVHQRTELEAEITRERDHARGVMATLETALSPLPVEATRAVLNGLCEGWSRHFDLIHGGFMPTPGLRYEGVREDLQKWIQAVAPGPAGQAQINVARRLLERIDEPEIFSSLMRLRTLEGVAGSLVLQMIPLTREESSARLMLAQWRLARQQVEQAHCREVFRQRVGELFAVVPQHVELQHMVGVLNLIEQIWFSFANGLSGLMFSPELSLETGLAELVEHLIAEQAPNTSEAAFLHFKAVLSDPQNLSTMQVIRHALYMNSLVASDRERTLQDKEILERIGQSNPRHVSAHAMLRAGPDVMLEALQAVSANHPEFDEAALRATEMECYQQHARLFIKCREPGQLAEQCRTRILEEINKAIDQADTNGVFLKVAEATAVTRFLIDHFGHNASFNAELVSANNTLARKKNLPRGVVQSLEAWRKKLEASFVENAREAAKSTARWYMSEIEEKVWYLVHVLLA